MNIKMGKLALGLGLLGLASLLVVGATRTGETQPANAPKTLKIGIYAPTVQFRTSAARASYLRTLGNAIAIVVGATYFVCMALRIGGHHLS